MRDILLVDLQENYSVYSSVIRPECIDLILAASNDWPKPIDTLMSFNLSVTDFIQAETTKENIRLRLANLDIAQYAWEIESLTQLSSLFNFYPEHLRLTDILNSWIVQVESVRNNFGTTS